MVKIVLGYILLVVLVLASIYFLVDIVRGATKKDRKTSLSAFIIFVLADYFVYYGIKYFEMIHK